MNEKIDKLPICVDLDGTLIQGDVTIDAMGRYIAACFFNIFKIFFWFLRGRAYLKRKLSTHIELDTQKLSYNKIFLTFLTKKKEEGHRIFLATASDMMYAEKIADHLGIFDGVFASDGHINLRAEAKAETLVTIFGERGFIYAGNSVDDVFVWNRSAESILVTPTKAAMRLMDGRKYQIMNEEIPNER